MSYVIYAVLAIAVVIGRSYIDSFIIEKRCPINKRFRAISVIVSLAVLSISIPENINSFWIVSSMISAYLCHAGFYGIALNYFSNRRPTFDKNKLYFKGHIHLYEVRAVSIFLFFVWICFLYIAASNNYLPALK